MIHPNSTISATFLDEDERNIGTSKPIDRHAILGKDEDMVRRLMGSIPKQTARIEVHDADGIVTTMIYGTRERIDSYFAQQGQEEISPLGEMNAFDNIPGLKFIVDLRNTLRYYVDVPLPYDFGESVPVETYRDDISSLPRQLELSSQGFFRAIDLFDMATDRRGNYINFMRSIQEAQHLGEAVVVIHKGDHYILFIQTKRNAFNSPRGVD